MSADDTNDTKHVGPDAIATRPPNDQEFEALVEFNQVVLWQDFVSQGDDEFGVEAYEDASREMVLDSNIGVMDIFRVDDAGRLCRGSLLLVEWRACSSDTDVLFLDSDGCAHVLRIRTEPTDYAS